MTRQQPGRRRAASLKSARPGRGRTRALLSLAAVGALAVGLGTQGTFAYWTDQASVSTGSFTSGNLDITLNGALAGAANNGGATTLSALTLANMVPGESIAVSFPVANAGSVGVTYTVAGTATGALAPGMQWSVYPGTASNTGTAGANNRVGSCTGTALATNQVLTTSSATVVGTARALASGASENICVIARLDPAADNTLQGKTMSASLTFNAKQVGAP